jgi:hypothetical protein
MSPILAITASKSSGSYRPAHSHTPIMELRTSFGQDAASIHCAPQAVEFHKGVILRPLTGGIQHLADFTGQCLGVEGLL